MKNHHNTEIADSLHGFEKEGVRVTPDGALSHSPHPEGLGSSLMHPYITTDFTEPQLEFRTAPSESLDQVLLQLKEIHAFTTKALDGELIWPFSMPPSLPEKEADIPLAVYGNSAQGIGKTVYRRGIGLRYGRKRLTISGVHYNFSMDPSGFKGAMPGNSSNNNMLSMSETYFYIIRNLYRKIFYLTYLFGASPAFDKSFDPRGITRFKRHKSSTYYGPYATSFRAGDIGYTSTVQDQLPVNYDSLGTYIKSLSDAVFTCNPDYLKFAGHPFNQLNPNYLQTEYELYAPFRPKQVTAPGERLLDALKRKGPGYIELRLPDIDPQFPDGIDPHAMGFLHVTLVDCLMQQSPLLSLEESREIKAAHREIIWRGRKKGIKISTGRRCIFFHDSGKLFCEKLYPLAERMDLENGADFYRESVARQIEKWTSPETTPSGKLLAVLLDNNRGFIEQGIEIAERNSRYFDAYESDPSIQTDIETHTLLSVKKQKELETRERVKPVI